MNESKIDAVRRDELRPWTAAGVGGWTSGWLGISEYGVDTHGFAELSLADGHAEARISWLAETGEVYTPFRLRHDPGQ